jgi:predicted nucleic acid-binding protein
MTVLMDACSLINLSNAGQLETVTKLQRCRLGISPEVAGECNTGAALQIFQLAETGALDLISDHDVPADRFFDLKEDLRLGDGETECIAIAELHPFMFCCDDKKARAAAAAKFGEERILGSLRLLRWCVEEALMTAANAFEAYQEMIQYGGRLPIVEMAYFESG